MVGFLIRRWWNNSHNLDLEYERERAVKQMNERMIKQMISYEWENHHSNPPKDESIWIVNVERTVQWNDKAMQRW